MYQITCVRLQPTIILVTYNRPTALKRLLQSIASANYSGYSEIQLSISIDGGGESDTVSIANAFNWKHGQKTIIKHERNLGLRNHIIFCGELTRQSGNVVILEDDCFVSPNFYDYACQSINFYQAETKIAGISLYGYRFNENGNLPFQPLQDGYSTYFAQVPSSLGQIWTAMQWQNFKTYYDLNPVIALTDQLPRNVKEWPETSWKKYFYKYMVEIDLFFVYPQVSLATNFGDKGTHFNESTSVYQVPFETRLSPANYSFPAFNEGFNKYDAYFEMLPGCLKKYGIELPASTGIDLFGTKQLELFNDDYLLSIKDCNWPIQSYGLEMISLMQNVVHSIKGNSIHLGKKSDFSGSAERSKAEIVKRNQSNGYDYGKAAGIITATTATKNSNSYKLGHWLLHPLHSLKQLLIKGKK